MNFASDNVAPVPPEMLAAVVEANAGPSMPYGNDPWTKRLGEKLNELFDRKVTVFPVATGSAANALAVAAMVDPWGAVYCHTHAHIEEDECGAPEFFTGGAKLVPIAGDHGRLTPGALEDVLRGAGKGVVHRVQPQALSLTQATEAGTVYRPDEVAALSSLAHAQGLKVHMDGARFANALATLGCSPADVTWKAGIDILSFGATKNGAFAAEAIVVFDDALAETLAFRRKRAGHLFSKMRFLSVQLEAYVANGNWLRWAAHSNAMATLIADGLVANGSAELLHPVEANEVFVYMDDAVARGLEADGFVFYRRGDPARPMLRLVTGWNAERADCERFVERAGFHLKAASQGTNASAATNAAQ